MTRQTQQQGFTLIELMITVAIIAILAAVAYPSYNEYVQRGHRSEGQALLNDTAALQERFYAQNFAYVTATADIATKLRGKASSPTGKYNLTLGAGAATDGGYLLTATQQFSDTACGNLTLNALGVRGRTGSGKTIAECWR